MSNRQDRPLAKKLLHALGLLALALFLLYVAVQFVLIFHRSYKTETAIRYTLAESLNLTGVVAFDAVDVPGSGSLGYLVQDGERVTNGTVVAECYTDDTQGLQHTSGTPCSQAACTAACWRCPCHQKRHCPISVLQSRQSHAGSSSCRSPRGPGR